VHQYAMSATWVLDGGRIGTIPLSLEDGRVHNLYRSSLKDLRVSQDVLINVSRKGHVCALTAAFDSLACAGCRPRRAAPAGCYAVAAGLRSCRRCPLSVLIFSRLPYPHPQPLTLTLTLSPSPSHPHHRTLSHSTSHPHPLT
jgi:hypothetical protein